MRATQVRIRKPGELPSATEIETFAVSRRSVMIHTEFARKLGVNPRIVRDAFERGLLPGAVKLSAYRLLVPIFLMRLSLFYGLHAVTEMARAGLIAPAKGKPIYRPSLELPGGPEISPTERAAVAAWLGQRMMPHTEFAQALGISQRVVRDAFKRGGLPGAVAHSAYILMVPTHLFRLAAVYGLRHVERLATAGRLSDASDVSSIDFLG